MSEGAKEGFRQPGGIFSLWLGVLAGPVVWIFDQQIKYMFLTYLCSPTGLALLHIVSFISLALIGTAAVISWLNWQSAGGGEPDGKGGTMARSRFMGVLGLLMNGLFSLLIIAQWLPGFFFNPCQR
jgi:hypothetical protein